MNPMNDQQPGESTQSPGELESGRTYDKTVERGKTVERDPRKFNPKRDPFPEDEKISEALEFKLDVLIVLLDRIFNRLGCLGCLYVPLIGVGIVLLGTISYVLLFRPTPPFSATPIVERQIATQLVERTVIVTPEEEVMPTIAETPPPCLTFDDPINDTFDRNNGQPLVDHFQADIEKLIICGDEDTVTFSVDMGESFEAGDYSYNITTVFTNSLSQPYTFLYQVHDSISTIGEVDRNFSLLPDSPVSITYRYGDSMLDVMLPASYLYSLNPPFQVYVESFFMSTPTSPLVGDETDEFGPIDFFALVSPRLSFTYDIRAEEPSAPEAPMLRIETPTYCRLEPNLESPEEWTLNAGDTFPILGIYEGWWLVGIDDPRTRTKCCWVGAGVLQGDITAIPVLATIPPPGICP